MAIALGRRVGGLHGYVPSLLARVPLTGGAPREVAENVVGAEWGPDGKTLIVVRRLGGGPGSSTRSERSFTTQPA